MDELRDKIFANLAEIKRLSEEAASKIKEDKAHIWNEVSKFIQITKLLYVTINLDANRFRLFLDRVGVLISILKTEEHSQKREIEHWGIEQWFERFQHLIKEFADFIFYSYLYYFTYDTFSENSRDNQKKAESIEKLLDENSNLLEIGCGTAPLMRRLIPKGYNIISLEVDPAMIQEALTKCPEAQGKIIQADFFEYNLGNDRFELIFIESGLFMFTRIGKNRLVFELFSGVTNQSLERGLQKIFNALKKGGFFLIGIQGLMKHIKLGHEIYFSMKRKQETDKAIRELIYYRKRGRLSKKEVLYTINQEKPTMPYDKFVSFANSIGFADIVISDDGQWVVLKK